MLFQTDILQKQYVAGRPSEISKQVNAKLQILTGKMFGVVGVIMLAIVAKETEAYRTYNTGRGMVYRLGISQDTTLEGSKQHNRLQYLLVSKFPQYENKRSLVQFENLPNACSPLQIISAKMYLYYVYAHKASWQSIRTTPFNPALCRCCNKSIRYLGPFSLLSFNPGAYKIDLVAVQIQSGSAVHETKYQY